MGIPGLNRFITERAKGRGIGSTSFRALSGRLVAVDVSMYLYRALAGVGLATGLYQIIGALRKAGVEPVFVFDGKPPPDKDQLLTRRRNNRRRAEELLEQIESKNEHELTIEESYTATKLRKQTVRIRWKDTESAKKFISAAGCAWWQAHGEADSLCVALVMEGKVWACMSDDMDIVAAGCPRILRKGSFLRGTCLLYDTSRIAATLQLPASDWPAWAALAGCDYGTGRGIETSYKDMLRGGVVLDQQQNRSRLLLENWKSGSSRLGTLEPARHIAYPDLTNMLREEGVIFAPHCSLASIAPQKTVEDNIRFISK